MVTFPALTPVTLPFLSTFATVLSEVVQVTPSLVGFPFPAAKKARRVEEKTVFVLKREDTVALRKREDNGLLAGLWEFPNEDYRLEESAVFEHLNAHGLTVTGWIKQLTARHIFTHIEWHMTGYVLEVKGADDLGLTWVAAEEFSKYAIPSAFAKFTKEVTEIL